MNRMRLYEELKSVSEDGLQMSELLKRAKAEGHTRSEAIDVLEKLFEEAALSDDPLKADLLVDMLDIVKSRCLPQNRIWD